MCGGTQKLSSVLKETAPKPGLGHPHRRCCQATLAPKGPQSQSDRQTYRQTHTQSHTPVQRAFPSTTQPHSVPVTSPPLVTALWSHREPRNLFLSLSLSLSHTHTHTHTIIAHPTHVSVSADGPVHSHSHTYTHITTKAQSPWYSHTLTCRIRGALGPTNPAASKHSSSYRHPGPFVGEPRAVPCSLENHFESSQTHTVSQEPTLGRAWDMRSHLWAPESLFKKRSSRARPRSLPILQHQPQHPER